MNAAAEANGALQVIIIEKTGKLLSKVKVSGGGRCNVTHACFQNSNLIKNYPRGASFLKKSFSGFSATDTVEWFEKRGVHLSTESDGRMFPDTNTSDTIIECLIKEANRNQVQIMLNSQVERIEQLASGFMLQLNRDRNIRADYVCLACGGLSHSNQFGWLTQLGHSIVPPVPSLFTFNLPKHPVTALMGVTVTDVLVKLAGSNLQQRGPLLITHWGFSGPAILKLSAWAARELADKNYEASVIVNWLPEFHENSVREKLQQLRMTQAAQKITARNPFSLPARLWEYLLHTAGIAELTRWADLPAKEQNLLAKILTGQSFTISGKTTFKEEFVTAGGISLSELDAHTLESKKMPGLYFAGEVIDVDGVTGGFNFQNAWTTGYIAAHSIAAKLK